MCQSETLTVSNLLAHEWDIRSLIQGLRGVVFLRTPCHHYHLIAKSWVIIGWWMLIDVLDPTNEYHTRPLPVTMLTSITDPR